MTATIYEETIYRADGVKVVRRLYESNRCILRLAVTESTDKRALTYDRIATLEDHARATAAMLEALTQTLQH